MLLKGAPNGRTIPFSSSSDDLANAMPMRPLRLYSQSNNNGSLP